MTFSDTRTPAAFYSYTRADDDHDRGYLTDLRRALSAEASAQIGDDFVIFQDRDDILWGQRWKKRIEESIDSATALVAVLTPRFFKSDACREEWERFRQREKDLGGRDDLILPIYYIPVPGWGVDSEDSWIAEAASRQVIDWTELRFAPLSETAVRKKVAELAARMVAAVSAKPTVAIASEQATGVKDDAEEIGFVELLAESEEAMPLFNQTISDFAEEMNGLGAIATEFSGRIEAGNLGANPMAARLTAMRQLATAYAQPAERMEALAADYLDQLARVDGGIRALIARVPELTDPDEIASARELGENLERLAEQGQEGLDALDGFRGSLRTVGQMSSTVRPVVGRMDQATASLTPTKATFREWADAMTEALSELDRHS